MNLIVKKLILSTKTNDLFPVDLRYPSGNNKMPAVFILHGFKAWKDWGFFPYVSEKIASAGVIVITLSFSLNGVPAGSDLYLEPEKFADNTVSREIADSNLVLDSFLNNELLEKDDLWNGKIYLLGHSRGAAISILVAEKRKEIDGLILWSTISRFGRISDRLKDNYKKFGFVEFNDIRTGVKLRMNKVYADDLELNIEQYSLPETVGSLYIPVLFLHGTQDVTVPAKESIELYEKVKNNNINNKLILIEHAGHTFGISHPFDTTNSALEELLTETVDFLNLRYFEG